MPPSSMAIETVPGVSVMELAKIARPTFVRCTIGAVIMFGVLGFLPAFIVSKILNGMGLLRIPRKVELEGLDFESNQAYEAAMADVIAAETKMVK